MKTVTELKFLGAMIGKNLNLKSHIKLIWNQILKNIGVLFKGSLHMNKKCLSVIIFLIYAFIYKSW